MNELLIFISVICFAANSFFTRLYQVKFPDNPGGLKLYQSMFCLISAVAFFIGGGLRFDFSAGVLVFGFLFGIFFFLTVLCSAIGFEKGSMSLTEVIVNTSLILPLMYTAVVKHESVSGLQYLGVTLIFVVLFLSSSSDGGKDKKKLSLIWLIPVIVAFFSNGLTAVIQNYFCTNYGEDSLMQFMSAAYLTAAVAFFADFGVCRIRKIYPEETIPAKTLVKTMLLAVPSGLGSYGGNALLGLLCLKVAGAVLYPCVNGGLCVVTALASFLIFKEKPDRRKILSIILGIIAIVILNI